MSATLQHSIASGEVDQRATKWVTHSLTTHSLATHTVADEYPAPSLQLPLPRIAPASSPYASPRMEAPTMQQVDSSPFLDHYADPSSKAHKDGTTGLDSTPFEAPRRIQNRNRILVSYPVYPVIQRVAKHFHRTFPRMRAFSRRLGSLVAKDVK